MKNPKLSSKISRRIEAALLVLALIISIFPTTAFSLNHSSEFRPGNNSLSPETNSPSSEEQVHSVYSNTAFSAATNSNSNEEKDIYFNVQFLDFKKQPIGELQAVALGESADPPRSIPTPEGKRFIGWSSTAYLNVQDDVNIEALYEVADQPLSTENLEATVEIDVFPENLIVNDNYKEMGKKDPKPTLRGLPKYLVEGVDYIVEYKREVGEEILSQGYKISVKNFRFINLNYQLKGDFQNIKEGYLYIIPRNITFSAGNVVKPYNGTNIAGASYSITGSGLMPGDKVSIAFSGYQKDVGFSENTITSLIIKNANNDVVNRNYNITLKAGTLRVTKAQLSIRVDNKTIAYNDSDPQYTFTYSGFVPGETEEVLLTLPKASTFYRSGSTPGTYIISCGGATTPNYNITYYAGTLTVTNAADQITVTAASASKVYDGTPLTCNSYEVDGLPADFSVDVVIRGSITNVLDNATLNNEVTSVIVRDKDGQDVTDYFPPIIKTSSTLSITPATLLAMADNKEVEYSSSAPTYTVTYSGFVNGECESVLEKPVTITSTYSPGDQVGVYTISVSDGIASNYTITYINGTLTILPYVKSITVIGSSATKTYDGLPISDNSFTVEGVLPKGHRVLATVTGSATDVADSMEGNNTVTDVKIINSQDEDVTDNFTNINNINGSLMIIPTPLSIDILDEIIEYDDESPTFQAIYDGFVNGELPEVLEGNLIISCPYRDGDHMGTYPVTCRGVTAENYEITYLSGELVVTAKDDPIKVIAASQSKDYDGLPLTDATFTQTGLPDGFTMEVTIVGSVTNVEDTKTNNNHITSIIIRDEMQQDVTADFSNIEKINGTLSIRPRTVTIAVENTSKKYMEDDPLFTAKIMGVTKSDTLGYTLFRDQGEQTGTYTIHVSVEDNKNYNVKATEGTFTIKSGSVKAAKTGEQPTQMHTLLSFLALLAGTCLMGLLVSKKFYRKQNIHHISRN